MKALKPTLMSIKLATQSMKRPLGLIEDVLVKVSNFIVHINFVVIDMEGEKVQIIIFGYPFLAPHKGSNRHGITQIGPPCWNWKGNILCVPTPSITYTQKKREEDLLLLEFNSCTEKFKKEIVIIEEEVQGLNSGQKPSVGEQSHKSP